MSNFFSRTNGKRNLKGIPLGMVKVFGRTGLMGFKKILDTIPVSIKVESVKTNIDGGDVSKLILQQYAPC